MNLSISDKQVRKAVYRAFKGECFFTGRHIAESEMVIDHLIPKSKGGEDTFDNYVLTFRDLNAGKSNKLDEELIRMKWAIKNIYAPRARKLYKKFSSEIKLDFCTLDTNEDIKFNISKFKTRVNPPNNLNFIKNEDLFWVKDRQIQIFSTLNTCDFVKMIDGIRFIENNLDELNDEELYCNIAVCLSEETIKIIKSIWYCTNSCFFKSIKKVESVGAHTGNCFSRVYYTKQYTKFINWQKSTNEILEYIFEIDDHEKHKKALRRFCTLYPQPS